MAKGSAGVTTRCHFKSPGALRTERFVAEEDSVSETVGEQRPLAVAWTAACGGTRRKGPLPYCAHVHDARRVAFVGPFVSNE